MFVCNTTEGSLQWETNSAPAANWEYDNNLKRKSPEKFGNFTLYRNGVHEVLAVNVNDANKTAAVNSTAVLTDPVQQSHDGVTLRCSENSNLSKFSEAVLSVGKSQTI